MPIWQRCHKIRHNKERLRHTAVLDVRELFLPISFYGSNLNLLHHPTAVFFSSVMITGRCAHFGE